QRISENVQQGRAVSAPRLFAAEGFKIPASGQTALERVFFCCAIKKLILTAAGRGRPAWPKK
ncbi:hypothetical protein, partial [Ruthenibacterium lactatiformans]|uniref:hypothetical protein n=1 Tax=Ruthenibacterium lactatiformans TaxID=1550024 RepID=UPI0026DCF10F